MKIRFAFAIGAFLYGLVMTVLGIVMAPELNDTGFTTMCIGLVFVLAAVVLALALEWEGASTADR